MRSLRPIPKLLALAFMIFAGSCVEAEPEPIGWHAACEPAACSSGLSCMPNPQSGAPGAPPKVCTRTCSTDDDCPVPNDMSCQAQFPCIGGVCGGNWTCR